MGKILPKAHAESNHCFGTCMRAVLRMGGGGIYNGFPAASNDTAFPCSAGFGFSAWPMAAMLWHWGERKGFTFTFKLKNKLKKQKGIGMHAAAAHAHFVT